MEERENVSPNVENQSNKVKNYYITTVFVVVGIVIAIAILVRGDFEKSSGSNYKVIDAAETQAKQIVAQAYEEVPTVTSEVLASGEDWAIVLTRYKGKDSLVQGSLIFGVTRTGVVYSNYKESRNYDLQVSKEEIEVMKAQWGFS